jgi:hypothetical protein
MADKETRTEEPTHPVDETGAADLVGWTAPDAVTGGTPPANLPPADLVGWTPPEGMTGMEEQPETSSETPQSRTAPAQARKV